MLSQKDELNEEWDGEEGLFDFDPESKKLPFALRRLANPDERRNNDSSAMGYDIVNIVIMIVRKRRLLMCKLTKGI